MQCLIVCLSSLLIKVCPHQNLFFLPTSCGYMTVPCLHYCYWLTWSMTLHPLSFHHSDGVTLLWWLRWLHFMVFIQKKRLSLYSKCNHSFVPGFGLNKNSLNSGIWHHYLESFNNMSCCCTKKTQQDIMAMTVFLGLGKCLCHNWMNVLLQGKEYRITTVF